MVISLPAASLASSVVVGAATKKGMLHSPHNTAEMISTPGRLIWSFMTGPTNHLTEAHAANAYGLLESIVTVP